MADGSLTCGRARNHSTDGLVKPKREDVPRILTCTFASVIGTVHEPRTPPPEG